MNCLKRLQRFLAGFVVVIFFATNTLTPAPVAYAQNVELLNPAKLVEIPAEWGRVTDLVAVPQSSHVLIHIQEAHANYDAQKNIQNILQYLNKSYGIKLILVEGAGNRLKPELFKFFPGDSELQKTINEKLMQAGEFTGAEVFLMDASPGSGGWGVEKAEVYAEDHAAFKKVFEGRKLSDDFLAALQLEWQKQASLHLNKDLREFLARFSFLEEGKVPLQDWLETLKLKALRLLNIDLTDKNQQGEWPILVRYFRLKDISSRISAEETQKETNAFLHNIKTLQLPPDLFAKIESLLSDRKNKELPVYKTRFVFEKLLDALPKDYSFEAYPNLRLHIQQLILLSELQGDQLQKEIRGLTKRAIEKLVLTDEERHFVGFLREYQLLKKLFHLELDREEFRTIQARTINPGKLMKSLGQNASGLSKIDDLFGTAMNFYGKAIERENWMMRNTIIRMNEQKQSKAILITGGFHTKGFKEKILQSGSSYVQITPAIGEITNEEHRNYLRALLGLETTDNSPHSQQAERSGNWGSPDYHKLKENKSQDRPQPKPLPSSSLSQGERDGVRGLLSPVSGLQSSVHERSEVSHLGFPATSDIPFIQTLPDGKTLLAFRRAEMRETGRQVIASTRPAQFEELFSGYEAQLARIFNQADAANDAALETRVRRNIESELTAAPEKRSEVRSPTPTGFTTPLGRRLVAKGPGGEVVAWEVNARKIGISVDGKNFFAKNRKELIAGLEKINIQVKSQGEQEIMLVGAPFRWNDTVLLEDEILAVRSELRETSRRVIASERPAQSGELFPGYEGKRNKVFQAADKANRRFLETVAKDQAKLNIAESFALSIPLAKGSVRSEIRSKILIVDDDAGVQNALARTFKLEGYEVVTAGSVEAALAEHRKAAEAGAPFALGVFDWEIQNKNDGARLAKGVKDLPIIFSSSAVYNESASNSPEVEAALKELRQLKVDFSIVSKPADIGELLATAGRIIESRKKKTEPSPGPRSAASTSVEPPRLEDQARLAASQAARPRRAETRAEPFGPFSRDGMIDHLPQLIGQLWKYAGVRDIELVYSGDGDLQRTYTADSLPGWRDQLNELAGFLRAASAGSKLLKGVTTEAEGVTVITITEMKKSLSVMDEDFDVDQIQKGIQGVLLGLSQMEKKFRGVYLFIEDLHTQHEMIQMTADMAGSWMSTGSQQIKTELIYAYDDLPDFNFIFKLILRRYPDGSADLVVTPKEITERYQNIGLLEQLLEDLKVRFVVHIEADKKSQSAARAETRVLQPYTQKLLEDVEKLETSRPHLGQLPELKRALGRSDFTHAAEIARSLRALEPSTDPLFNDVLNRVSSLRSETRANLEPPSVAVVSLHSEPKDSVGRSAPGTDSKSRSELRIVQEFLIAGGVFCFGALIQRFLGKNGVKTLSKVVLLLLAAMGVAMVIKGLMVTFPALNNLPSEPPARIERELSQDRSSSTSSEARAMFQTVNPETGLRRSEIRSDEDEENNEAEGSEEVKRERKIRRATNAFEYEAKDSSKFQEARAFLLGLGLEAVPYLFAGGWHDKADRFTALLSEIKQKAGNQGAKVDDLIVTIILSRGYLFREQAAFLIEQGFLPVNDVKKILDHVASILEQPDHKDPLGTNASDANGIASRNGSLLELMGPCLKRTRSPFSSRARFRDLLTEYAFNREYFHNYSESIAALKSLEAFGSSGLEAILENALTLEQGTFNRLETFEDLRDKIEEIIKEHKDLYFPKLLKELHKQRYKLENIVWLLDCMGGWKGTSLNEVFPRQSREFLSGFGKLFREHYPTFKDLTASPLWTAPKNDPSGPEAALKDLRDFSEQIFSKDPLEVGQDPGEKLWELITAWGFSRAMGWASAWREANESGTRIDERIFNILMDSKVRAGTGEGDFSKVLVRTLEYDDPNLMREMFFYLLCTEKRVDWLLPDLIKFIAKHPLETTSLIPLVIIRLRLDPTKFSERQEITKLLAALLNKRGSSDLFLIRKLVQAVPYPRALSSVGEVRQHIGDLDDQYGTKGFIRFLRMKIHRQPSSENLKMMEAALRSIDEGKLDPLLSFVPEQFRGNLKQESEFGSVALPVSQMGLLFSWNETIKKIALEKGFKITSARDIIALSDKDLEAFITSVPASNQPDEERGLVLFLRTYQELRQRYLGGSQVLSKLAPGAQTHLEHGAYLAAVADLNKKIAELAADLDYEEPEEVFERTYAIDHSINEEEKWGFEPLGYALATKERSLAAFEKQEALRRFAIRAFEQYLNQFRETYLLQEKEGEAIVREEALQGFNKEKLKNVCRSLQQFLKLLGSSGLGSQDFNELSDVLSYEDLTVAQVKDVFKETSIRVERLMYVLQLLFGGHSRTIAAYLGEEKVRTFLGAQAAIKAQDAASTPQEVKAEKKLLGDLFSEEGLILFQNFLRENILLLDALKSKTPQLKVIQPKNKKMTENVIFFYPGMKKKEGLLLVSQLGNKGAMLAKMAEAGYPVPPGFTITTDHLAGLAQEGKEQKLRAVVFKNMLQLEQKAGKYFPFNKEKLTAEEAKQLEASRSGWGPSSREPLIVSVRSGSFVPLPGVLDTFLKMPVTQRIMKQLIDAGVPRRIALDDRRRYLTSYATVVLGFQEAFFSDLISHVKEQIGMSERSINEFDDKQMERLAMNFENEIRRALHQLGAIAYMSFDTPFWPQFLLQSLDRLKGEETGQSQIHTSTHFGMDFAQLKALALSNSPGDREQLKSLVLNLRKHYEEWTAVKDNYDGDEFELLLLAVNEITRSWDSYRAKKARAEKGTSDDWRTPATIEAMVFGNRGEDSGAFVAQTHHPVTGVLMPDGDFKFRGEGEDLVSGRTREAWRLRPSALEDKSSLKEKNPELFKRLLDFLKGQSLFGGGPRQIEGIVQEGRIYILQNIGVNLIGSFPRLVPENDQKPVMRGEGGAGGARHVRIFFDRHSFSRLKTRVEKLRKAMDQAGEKDIGIAVITGYVTPEEAEKINLPGVDALIVTAVGGSAHAAIAARDAGKILISSIGTLKKHPIVDEKSGQVEEVWSLNGKDLVEGREEGSKIYSIDGNYSGPTAGCIYEGKIRIDAAKESDKQSLAAILGERNKSFSRSELRSKANIFDADSGAKILKILDIHGVFYKAAMAASPDQELVALINDKWEVVRSLRAEQKKIPSTVNEWKAFLDHNETAWALFEKAAAEQIRSEMRDVRENENAEMDAWKHHWRGFGGKDEEGVLVAGPSGFVFVSKAVHEKIQTTLASLSPQTTARVIDRVSRSEVRRDVGAIMEERIKGLERTYPEIMKIWEILLGASPLKSSFETINKSADAPSLAAAFKEAETILTKALEERRRSILLRVFDFTKSELWVYPAGSAFFAAAFIFSSQEIKWVTGLAFIGVSVWGSMPSYLRWFVGEKQPGIVNGKRVPLSRKVDLYGKLLLDAFNHIMVQTMIQEERTAVSKSRSTNRSEARISAKAGEEEVRARLQTLASSTDPEVRRRAKQFLSQPFVSDGRKGSANFIRAKEFINETVASRSEVREGKETSYSLTVIGPRGYRQGDRKGTWLRVVDQTGREGWYQPSGQWTGSGAHMIWGTVEVRKEDDGTPVFSVPKRTRKAHVAEKEDAPQKAPVSEKKALFSAAERSVRVEPHGEQSFSVRMSVRMGDEALKGRQIFVHFGPYDGGSVWQDQEIASEGIFSGKEEGQYEIHAAINPSDAFPGKTGEFGATFFALPQGISREDAGFFNKRSWIGTPKDDVRFQVSLPKVQQEVQPSRSEMREMTIEMPNFFTLGAVGKKELGLRPQEVVRSGTKERSYYIAHHDIVLGDRGSVNLKIGSAELVLKNTGQAGRFRMDPAASIFKLEKKFKSSAISEAVAHWRDVYTRTPLERVEIPLKPEASQPLDMIRPAADQSRSEVREDQGKWAAHNTPRVAGQHIYSRQNEAGYPMHVLKKIEELYDAYRAGQISQTTLTGGLGALLPDLFEAWAAIGMNVTGIHPLWNFIKNKPVKGLDEEGQRILFGEIVKKAMELTPVEIKVQTIRRGVPTTVFFRIYRTYYQEHRSPQYYLDGYTKTEDGKEEPFFDEVYDDTGVREIHMAVFQEASERLIQVLEDNPDPGNVVILDHEVFVSLPQVFLKKAKRVTLNHTVFRPGLFEAWEGHYRLFKFPEWLRSVIVHDGKISIADFTAEIYDLISGVNLVEHLPALFKNIFRTAWHRVKGFYDPERRIRSTNGVFLPRWQSGSRRAVIEHYKKELGIPEPGYGLPAEANDRMFFEELDKRPAMRESFKTKNEWVNAVDAARLLIWLGERRGSKSGSDWIGNTFRDYQQAQGLDGAGLAAHLKEMQRLLQKAVQENSPEDWAALESGFSKTRDLILADPIASNVRRQVAYKGPDKYEEILAEKILGQISGAAEEAARAAGISADRSGKANRSFDPLFQFWKSYRKGDSKDHARFEKEFNLIRAHLKDQPAVEEVRKSICRVLIGGRTFDEADAYERFLYIGFLSELLGLEDRSATLDDYNYYEAGIIFSGVQAGIMLSDKDLEASATSMMKSMTNGGEVVGPFAGSNPEIWVIRDTKTGKDVDVLTEKGEPAFDYKVLREKLRGGKWQLLNGVYVDYDESEKSAQEGGEWRPSARSLLEALRTVKKLRQDPETRRERMYQSVANAWRVDMVTGQAMGHAFLIENMLKEAEEREAMFSQLRFSASDYAVPAKSPDFEWQGISGNRKHSAPGMGLFGMFKSFRELKTWQNQVAKKQPDGSIKEVYDAATRGIESLNSIKHHAYFGDIFRYFKQNFLDQLSPGLDPFKWQIESLALEAEKAGEKERVVLNLQAMDLMEMLLVRMAGDWFERYMKADPKEAGRLARELTQETWVEYQPWAEYISRYLGGHPDATSLRTHNNKIASFVFSPQGRQPVLVNLNFGAPAKMEKEKNTKGYKARTQVFIDDAAFQKLVNNTPEAQIFQVREPRLDKNYRIHAKQNPVTVLGVGIPMPLGVEVLELRPIASSLLSSSLLEPVRLLEQVDAAPLRQLIREAGEGYEPKPEAVPAGEQFFEQLLESKASHEPAEAAALFGDKIKLNMTLIGLFRPDLLNTPRVVSWDQGFYTKLGVSLSPLRSDPALETPGAAPHHFYVLDASHKSSLVIAEKRDTGDVFVAAFQLDASAREVASDGKVDTQVSTTGLDQIFEPGATYQVYDLLEKIYYGERDDLLQGWTIRVPFGDSADRVQLLWLKKKTAPIPLPASVSATKPQTDSSSGEEVSAVDPDKSRSEMRSDEPVTRAEETPVAMVERTNGLVMILDSYKRERRLNSIKAQRFENVRKAAQELIGKMEALISVQQTPGAKELPEGFAEAKDRLAAALRSEVRQVKVLTDVELGSVTDPEALGRVLQDTLREVPQGTVLRAATVNQMLFAPLQSLGFVPDQTESVMSAIIASNVKALLNDPNATITGVTFNGQSRVFQVLWRDGARASLELARGLSEKDSGRDVYSQNFKSFLMQGPNERNKNALVTYLNSGLIKVREGFLVIPVNFSLPDEVNVHTLASGISMEPVPVISEKSYKEQEEAERERIAKEKVLADLERQIQLRQEREAEALEGKRLKEVAQKIQERVTLLKRGILGAVVLAVLGLGVFLIADILKVNNAQRKEETAQREQRMKANQEASDLLEKGVREKFFEKFPGDPEKKNTLLRTIGLKVKNGEKITPDDIARLLLYQESADGIAQLGEKLFGDVSREDFDKRVAASILKADPKLLDVVMTRGQLEKMNTGKEVLASKGLLTSRTLELLNEVNRSRTGKAPAKSPEEFKERALKLFSDIIEVEFRERLAKMASLRLWVAADEKEGSFPADLKKQLTGDAIREAVSAEWQEAAELLKTDLAVGLTQILTDLEMGRPAAPAGKQNVPQEKTPKTEKQEEASDRSEVREQIRESGLVPSATQKADRRDSAKLLTSPELLHIKTPEEFFKINQEKGGGAEQGVRGVTEKIMDGIIPLLAHALNAAELLIPAAARVPAVQKIHAEAAKRVLGLAPGIGYAFILGSDLALRKGMIEMAKTVLKDSAFAILVKNDPAMAAKAEALIKLEGLQDRVFVITDVKHARARISKPGAALRGMISSEELMLAEELKAELKDDLIVMDKGMQRRFLNAAGQLFQSLADKIAAQFALARSA